MNVALEDHHLRYPYGIVYKCPKRAIRKLRRYVLNDTFGRGVNDGESLITKTSWFDNSRDEENDRSFRTFFRSVFYDEYSRWMKEYYGLDLEPVNLWYQIYYHNDVHSWHVHDGVDFANVMYLQLKDPTIATQYRMYNGRIYTPQVKEGDVLTFNSKLLHCSPPNTTNSVKIVISFNTNLI